MYPIFVPDCTFLACFGTMSGKFGQAMVHISAKCSWTKMPNGEAIQACYVTKVYQKSYDYLAK